MASKRTARIVLISAIGVVLTVGVGYVLLRFTGLIPSDACVSEDLKTIPNLSGMRFKVEYTNCDAFVKDEAVSVYVARADREADSWFAKWANRRTLIFRYDPGRKNPLPSIEASGKDRILISVPEVSSVILQSRRWHNVSIEYKIEHNMNP